MSKVFQIATATALVACSASAQEFYVGGTVSTGQIDFASAFEGNVQSISLLAGGRYPIGGTSTSGLFLGAELEASFGQGFDVAGFEEVEDNQTTIQGELHVGYAMDKFTVYGFYGVGSNPMERAYSYGETNLAIYGVGAELDIGNNLALRAEYEMSSMSIDACSTYDPVEHGRFSVGCVLKF